MTSAHGAAICCPLMFLSQILVQNIGSIQLAQVHAPRHFRQHQNICDGAFQQKLVLCVVCATREFANPEDLLKFARIHLGEF